MSTASQDLQLRAAKAESLESHVGARRSSSAALWRGEPLALILIITKGLDWYKC